MSDTEILVTRIERDIETIAGFTESDPSAGYSRPTFSPAWRKARDYVMGEAVLAGCEVRIDAAGNLHARQKRLGWQERAWLCGSHLDSVPSGGRFDGVAGVVIALELLRANPQAAVELVVFAEEEGTTFDSGMVGSRAWAGTIGAQELRTLRNQRGESYATAGAPHGVRIVDVERERLAPERYRGLIEVHVEQGPGMWRDGVPVAVVTAINGRRQYRCTLEGEANHAGSTKMRDRSDALVGAAGAVASIAGLALELDREVDHTVMTVGKLSVEPNALNVIPGRVRFSVDFRAASDPLLERGEQLLRGTVAEYASRSRLQLAWERTELLPVIPLDPSVCGLLQEAAARLKIPLPAVRSGALHDTAILAPYLPSAMIFVASRDGISHNPKEFSRIEDVALAARIVAAAVYG